LPTAHSLWPKVKLQVPPLRYPGFPVELVGVGELHATFLTESRTRGRWLTPHSRKFGYASVGMTKWRVVAHLGSRGAGWTESTNEGPHISPACPLIDWTENLPSVNRYRQSCKRAYCFGDGWKSNGAK
jgi:hypothetical protein